MSSTGSETPTLHDEGEATDDPMESDSSDDDHISSVPVPNLSLSRRTNRGITGNSARGSVVSHHRVEDFADADNADNEMINEGMRDLVGEVLKCAKKMLPEISVDREREKVYKKCHDTVSKICEVQAKIELMPETVNKVFVDKGLEKPVDLSESNEVFTTKINEFGVEAMKATDDKCKLVKYANVCQSRLYQSALRDLNKFNAPKEAPAAASTSQPPAPAPPQNSEGLETLTDYVPTRDPFTKRPLKNIRVNKRCRHVYEYDSIMGMITTSNSRTGVKCPYPGCFNKRVIMADLEEDASLSQKIAEKISNDGIV